MKELVVVDYETIELLPDGSSVACAEFWKHSFRVSSCAFTHISEDGTKRSSFVQGEKEVGDYLRTLQDSRILVYNATFEIGVTTCRFPDIKLDFYCDVMRLVQLYDGGGGYESFDMVVIEDDITRDNLEELDEIPTEPKYKKVSVSGFGLAKSAVRILGRQDHKKEAHDYLYKNVPGCRKGQAGKHLDKLPYDLLERYNIGDTEATADLYEFITTQFAIQEYDWTTDHNFYMASVKRLVESEIRGIPVDRDGLMTFKDETIKEIEDIGLKFRTTYKEEIRQVELQKIVDWVLEPKTAKGQRKRWQKYLEGVDDSMLKATVFNPGSNKQLGLLFEGVLKIKPVFFTEKGASSFKSSHLHQWGDAGMILLARRKRLIVQKQAEAILRQSEFDGRLHTRLKAVGTKTGRFSGTGGVNIQALSRREKNLMNKLLPDPGYIFVSSDALGCEPTIITQYTKDRMYKYFCFDGIGKEPYYDGDNLMIGDIYLGYAAKCPLFAKDMRDIFDNETFDGKSFAEQWVIDPEVVKNHKRVKSIRKNGKWMALAFGYGLGQKSVVSKAIEAGLNVKPSDGAKCFNSYWGTFSGIKGFSNKLENHAKAIGWFSNDFGYRFTPEQPRLAFNGFIQSSVSSIFHWYGILMDHFMPEAKYVFTCHDENIYMIPIGSEEKFKASLELLMKEMNDTLKWDVDMRFGAVFGKDMYEAK